VASSWIIARATRDGGKRYRVLFRLGGRESRQRYGGSFKTKHEALERRRWVDGELAALRVPDLRLVEQAPSFVTVRQAAERWQAARVDVSPGTLATYRVSLGRILPRLGTKPLDELDAQTVADLVAELHAAGLKKQTIRKTVSVLAMLLDHARIEPNPARDRLTVRLPRERRRQVQPPTAEHVESVVRLLPSRYRLPTLVLDATGMRVGELEALTWGDIDEPRGLADRHEQDRPAALDHASPSPVCRRARTRRARRPHRRSAGVPRVRRRPLPHRANPRLHRRRRASVLAA